MENNGGAFINQDEKNFYQGKPGNLEPNNDEVTSLFLLNALPQQVWMANAAGQINYVNEMICRDFGFNRSLVVRNGWKTFVHPDDLQVSVERWTESLQTENEYNTEFRLRFADGEYYWHLARAVAVKQDGKPTIWVGTNTNIHHQKTNEYRKDEFISIASHELKTPLTTIKGYNQIMIRQDKQGHFTSFLQKSAGQLKRLEKLISDLLDVSKINAGKMLFNLEHFDFSEMLHEAISSARQISPSHQIVLENEIQLQYKGDRFRLEQVVLNFLSNAVKYSPKAEIVKVATELRDGNIVVSVTDYGIGIAPKDLGKLFERYYRVDNSSSRFDGLGLGLFISAEIIKRHGGSFWIESELHKGSVFSFKLPLTPHHPIEAEIRTKNHYKDKYIAISCNEGDEIMHVEWTGYQDMRSVKHGGSLMIDYLKYNNCSKVFNDNRLVLGTWSEASDWAAEVWLPLMEQAGLKYFAWVLSPSAFSQLSAKKSVANDDKTSDILFFNQADEAMDWLKNK